MGQKFIARERFEFSNGAVGWRPGGPFDCLGPYAKVENCPIDGTALRRTCYATGYADTAFSVPACTRYRGQHVGGFFALDDGAIQFVPYDRYAGRLVPARARYTYQLFITGYRTPEGAEVSHADSLRAVREALLAEHGRAQRTGAGDEPSAALAWFGEHSSVTDVHPDLKFVMGPKGGVRKIRV
jgi:hypothetical protein